MFLRFQAPAKHSPDPPSISYQVIRRFIRSKAFESYFGIQLLTHMLNNMLKGEKLNQVSSSFSVKEQEEEEEAGDVASEALPSGEKPRKSPGETEEDSLSSDVSGSTVLYNVESAGEEKAKKANKRDFFTSDSSCEESEEGKRKERERESSDSAGAEDRELEKLLRMTEVHPNSRGRIAESGEEREEKKEREGREKRKEKSKEPEVSLMDCMDSEMPDHSNHDPVVEEEKSGNDFFSAINSQIKKSFLLSSDESHQSSDEKEENTAEKKEKKKKKKIESKEMKKGETDATKNKKDDLREFRVSDLSTCEEDDSEEEEEDESGEEVEDNSGEEVEEENSAKEPTREQSSDESVKCVHLVKRRKRTRAKSTGGSTSDLDSEEDCLQVNLKTELSPSKGRKNIKKILKKENLQVETKQALKMETERKRRVRERMQLFEDLFPEAKAPSSPLILDFDPETKEKLVVVDDSLSRHLKPHQKDGIRFMWNCCFESLKRLEEDSGSGCILAHCMGLGKTLQVITLVHTLFTHNTGVHTVLILSPLNTIRNWAHEFKTWQRNCKKKVRPFGLVLYRDRLKRLMRVRTWSRQGGVLIISYEMFRSMIKTDRKNSACSLLLDPGPDLVVCDEGHVLKNNSSALSRCISRIKTLRRIVLTGTPLQNNLVEYYCMVQFVKPNILGTMKEFKNRFVHPINNGQFEDSTQQDVRLMKRRAHVLHTMLDGFIQRFDYSVLTPFLPEKHEYVISVALTPSQENVYRLTITRCNEENHGLLKDFHWIQKVWTHPRTLELYMRKNNVDELTRKQCRECFREEDHEEIHSSGKLLLLFSILKRSKEVGDKVLVFSQSLLSLDLIEHFLQKANREHSQGLQTEFADSWVPKKDYFRLDGSTSSETRDDFCQKFNDVSNDRFRLFIVSTKAGCLGINLVAANRVVVFDVSWNPTHDVQSIFRVYRFGQNKPCFIYRFLAAATMEEKIYRRQVTKLSLAHRILDEHQIERHYTMGNLQELYTYDPIPRRDWKIPKIPKDNLFAAVLMRWRSIIVHYHEHDSLLENKEEEELTEEERRAAWEDFEKEKLTPEGPLNPTALVASINGQFHRMVRGLQDQGPQAGAAAKPAQAEQQMCKIVDVRTLHEDENTFRRMDSRRLVELGASFGLSPFQRETHEEYCVRVGKTLEKIFPWGIPQGVVKGSLNNEV